MPGKVLFCNSGAEANEAALKMSRRTGRTKIVVDRRRLPRPHDGRAHADRPARPSVRRSSRCSLGSRTSRSVTSARSRPRSTTRRPRSSSSRSRASRASSSRRTGYLQAAREITATHGALLILDEVQTGVGRLGTWFAFQQAGIVPDIITLAKGLGGGLPLGACIGFGAAADLFKPGHHGTTFGGNPVCCAAALAVLDTIAAEGLLEHASSVGKEIAAGVEALHHPLISGVRGAGLLLGVMLREAVSAKAAAAAQKAGYLINPIQPDVIRLAPPLILDESDAQSFVAALPTFFEEQS